MYNGAWRRARVKVALEWLRVRDLKHTFGRRLRAAGVPWETRKLLLGHANGDITTHCSAPESAELCEAPKKVVGAKFPENSRTGDHETRVRNGGYGWT